ncbi:bacteriocin immunity protein [Lonsdalea quercina]|uniref:bacteriocin immunity protein n=1 Tax=Lonsdalea quercina TaxID=71657 RepID=UPI0009DDEB93|nr:bacteriocin immunity protein [Lonsdalea quercina]
MNDIFRKNIAENDEKLDEPLEHFEKITSHPDASDLFFHTLEDDQCTPDGVTKYIKEWRKPQGLPLFKNSK